MVTDTGEPRCPLPPPVLQGHASPRPGRKAMGLGRPDLHHLPVTRQGPDQSTSCLQSSVSSRAKWAQGH